MRRGQVTVFIIVAVIIILAVFLSYQTTEQPITTPTIASPQQFIESCIGDVAERGLYKAASQGGYLHPSGAPEYEEPGDGFSHKEHYFFEDSILPYSIDGDKLFLRRTEDTENVVSKFIQQESENCYDLSAFEEQGYTFERSEILPKVQLDIGPTSTTVKAERPVKLLREGEEIKLDAVTVTLPLRYGLLHDIAKQFAEKTVPGEKYILSNHCKEFTPDKWINIYKTPNKFKMDYAVSIVDASTISKGKAPLKFNFAIKNIEVIGQCVG
ncbi:MAG: hypothetical protein ACE5FT_01195 [Candidatus Nanoarchaeia archaeon]